MEQVTELAATEEQTQGPEFCSFTIDPPSIVSGIGDLLDCMECNHNGCWYETPIDFTGIARSFTSSAAYHQSPLVFKRNVFEPMPYLSRPDFTTLAEDFVVLGNGHLEKRINRLGVKPSMAKYTRAGVNEGQYWQLKNYQDAYEFRKNSIIHLKNPCIHQEIYGTPDYLAGFISANLNHSATLFRTNYYENGSHAGVMVYLSAAWGDDKAVESLKNHSPKRAKVRRLKISLCMPPTVARMGFKYCHSHKSVPKMSLSASRTPPAMICCPCTAYHHNLWGSFRKAWAILGMLKRPQWCSGSMSYYR
ncbi:hypothetical protein NOM68_16940 [Proteus mirabilis]|nr:hypothetical protein [Proteus mirabilis]MCS6719023.1 hypothetical protein [Proteus mirabilis]MCS6723239.1 hypothetical protein [Proteus mirabilis]MCS6730323.1 hypothetical protein [Proteus mirabilis]MCS6737971.1 hypothetical protein [Proteus mirabilis]MCS6751094.1 hypothetical protein [Proteus mirabilis]